MSFFTPPVGRGELAGVSWHPPDSRGGPNEVNQMPNGHELCAIARTQLGLFSNEREDKRLIQLLKASLPG